MKMKFIRNNKTNRRMLVVAAQRGETLSTKQAERLADNTSTLLLDFSYEKQRGSGLALLNYDVEGLWSLRTYLAKRSLNPEELMGLLEATQGVLDLCSAEHLPAEGLLFDPEYVFVDAQCCPHFALLPLEGVPFQTRNSPLALLQAIGDTDKLQFATPDAEGLSRRLGDLLVDLEGVFSINKFRRFVEQEQSLSNDDVPEARQSVVDPPTSSVWASAGGGSSSASTDNGAFFWNPLAGFAEEETPAPVEEPVKEEPVVVTPEPVAAIPQPVAVTPEPAPAVTGTTGGYSPVGQENKAAAQIDGANRGVSPSGPTAVPVVQPVQAAPAVQPMQPTATPAAASGNLWLVRLVTGERYFLPLGQQVKAGRGSACEIRLLNNRKFSRTHAALTSTGQMVMVTDMGAANGVFVNGQRLQSMQSVLVTPGQRLRLADEDFSVMIG